MPRSARGQTKTSARVRAEKDLRNAFTMAAMMVAFGSGVSPYLLFNWDSTTFQVSRSLNELLVCVARDRKKDASREEIDENVVDEHFEDDVNGESDDEINVPSFSSTDVRNNNLGNSFQPVTTISSGETDIFIKYLNLHNSKGYVSPAVFVIADETMEPNELHICPIRNLTATANAGSGFIVFTKTRAAHTHFYEWFSRVVMLPFIHSCQNECATSSNEVR